MVGSNPLSRMMIPSQYAERVNAKDSLVHNPIFPHGRGNNEDFSL